MHRLGLPRNGFDEPVGDAVGVAVQHPHPMDPIDLTHHIDELRQAAFPVKVLAVTGGILRHQIDLGDAAGGKGFALLHHIFHGPAAEAPPDEGDGAVAAPVVAALRHLYIGKPRLIGQHPFPLHRKGLLLAVGRKVFALYCFRDGFRDYFIAADAQYHIRFGDLPGQLLAVALRQAAGDRHTLEVPLALGGAAFQYRIDGLLFGVLDEPAGIDDDRIAFGHIVADRKALLGQLRQ